MTAWLARSAVAISGSLLWSLAFKSAAILALALAATAVMRRARAAVRHALLAAAFGVLVALPMAIVLLPSTTIALDIAALVPPDEASKASEGPKIANGVPEISDLVWWTPAGARPVPWMATLWLCGALATLAPWMANWRRLQEIRRRSEAWTAGESRANQSTDEPGRRLSVRLSADVAAPVMCGWRHPQVLLPPDAPRWSDADLDRVFLHERAHVERRDWLVQILTRIVVAFYWFNPLAWIAWQRLRLESECACDDRVIERVDAVGYAEQLLALAGRRLIDRGTAALGMARRGQLARRVSSVLAETKCRGKAGWRRLLGSVLVAGAVGLTVASVRADVPGQDNGARFDAVFIANARARRFPGLPASTQNGGICDQFGAIALTDTCFRAQGVSVRDLIAYAYRPTYPFGSTALIDIARQIEGPASLDNPRFDITGRIRGHEWLSPQNTVELAGVVRALLADRFELHASDIVRPGSVLALRRLDEGPEKLRQASAECLRLRQLFREGKGPMPSPPLTAANCYGGVLAMNSAGRTSGPGSQWIGTGAMDMRGLARLASGILRDIVIDRTGIEGQFQFELEWATPRGNRDAPDARQANRVAFAGALESALGLTLAETPGTVDVLRVDRLQIPVLSAR